MRCGGSCSTWDSTARCCDRKSTTAWAVHFVDRVGSAPWSFFIRRRTPWDAPAVAAEDAPGADPQSAPIPGPEVLNLRDAEPGNAVRACEHHGCLVGSNNWAVAGSHTSTGAALVANDMHLGQRVPVIWYRMRLRTNPAQGTGIDLTGVTLPGAPVMVAGSNGHIAWGFTNSYGNWLDVRLVPCTAVGTSSLTGPSGTIAAAGAMGADSVHASAPVRFPSGADRAACCWRRTRNGVNAGLRPGWRRCRRRAISTF